MKIRMVLLAVSLVASLGCPGDDGDDDGDAWETYCETCNLDFLLPQVATAGATDCGSVGIGEDPSEVLACVEQALAHETPFVARQELQGIDSRVELGFAVDDDGVLQQLFYDSNICGALTCTQGCGPIVGISECNNPRIAAMPQYGIIECDDGSSMTLCEPPVRP